MSNYKVSVIIPIYNAQNTIKRCIDSIINQTIGFSNIELILYDDNSTDNTIKILKEYADTYKNIILISSDENSGYPGKGRNEGIKKATADYIMFIDSDDEYNADMCETLYNEIINENADIVSSTYECRDNISSKITSFDIKRGIHKEDKIILLNDDTFDFIECVIWNKIYKKSTLIQNDIKFPENRLSEDVYFIYSTLIYSDKIILLKNFNGLINHVSNTSMSQSANYDKIKGIITTDYEILNKYKENKLDVDYAFMFSNKMNWPLSMIYSSKVLDNKDQTKDLFNRIYAFEQEFDFDDSYMPFILRIPNKFILKKKFNLAILILKALRFSYTNKSLRKIHRWIS